MRRRSLSAFLSVSAALAGAVASQPQLLVPLTTPQTSRGSAGPGAMRAQPRPVETPEQQAARAFQATRVSGRALSRAIRRVNGELDWHADLGDARDVALQAGKPIVWFQVLGSRKGYT